MRKASFHGACLDSGDQQSVVEKQQSYTYREMVWVRFRPKSSRKASVFESLGTMPVRIPTLDGSFINFDIDIVKPSVPKIIGLGILDLFCLVLDNVENELVNRKIN